MEKASFTRLNKLFEIDASKRAYKVFLSDKNLLALIDNPKSFIILVFPRLASPSLVPGEHFVLKDLSFYEVAHLAYSEARQTRLEERERKCQEGTLRQVPAAGRPSSSFAVRPSTQKMKEPTAHPVQRARTSPPTSPSSASASSSSSSLSSSSSSDKLEVRVNRVVPPLFVRRKKKKIRI